MNNNTKMASLKTIFEKGNKQLSANDLNILFDLICKDLLEFHLNNIEDLNTIFSDNNNYNRLVNLYYNMYYYEFLANKQMEYQFDSKSVIDHSNNFNKYNDMSYAYSNQITGVVNELAQKYNITLKNRGQR